jgi:hypothetical protein
MQQLRYEDTFIAAMRTDAYLRYEDTFTAAMRTDAYAVYEVRHVAAEGRHRQTAL